MGNPDLDRAAISLLKNALCYGVDLHILNILLAFLFFYMQHSFYHFYTYVGKNSGFYSFLSIYFFTSFASKLFESFILFHVHTPYIKNGHLTFWHPALFCKLIHADHLRLALWTRFFLTGRLLFYHYKGSLFESVGFRKNHHQ